MLRPEMLWDGPTLGPKARESGVRKSAGADYAGGVEERSRRKGERFSVDVKGFQAV